MTRLHARMILQAARAGWGGVYVGGSWQPITIGMAAQAHNIIGD